MSFVQIIFLAGAAGVIGPLLAHLFARPRYRRIPFTMLRFLEAGTIESKSRRRMRDLLILLLRCAMIVLLAMLFAQPRMLMNMVADQTSEIHYLGIDNSLSMAYRDGAGTLLDQAKAATRKYVEDAKADARFNLYAFAGGVWAKNLNREQTLGEIDRVALAYRKPDVDSFVTLVADAAKNARQGTVSTFLASDFTRAFRQTMGEVRAQSDVTSLRVETIKPAREVNNLAVTEASVVGVRGKMLDLAATVVNYGQTSIARRLTVTVGTAKGDERDVIVPANQRRSYMLAATMPAAAEGDSVPVTVSLDAGDGLAEDDAYRMAVSLPKKAARHVLVVGANKDEAFLLTTALQALARNTSLESITVAAGTFADAVKLDPAVTHVVVFTSMPGFNDAACKALRAYVDAGGKAVFFVSATPAPTAIQKLWDKDVLAAQPGGFNTVAVQIGPVTDLRGTTDFDLDRAAAQSLRNYELDRLVMQGWYDCEPHTDAQCVWQFRTGQGFVFYRRIGRGASILVNTSADDTLGELLRSNASAAFCRYLLGRSERVEQYCGTCDGTIRIPLGDAGTRLRDREVWVRTCDNRESLATRAEGGIVVPDARGIGWVTAMTTPPRMAGVNATADETDLRPAPPQDVAALAAAVFRVAPLARSADLRPEEQQYKPLWRALAWSLIVLAIIEPAVANRLKR